MTDSTPIPVNITRNGATVATVIVRIPVSLELADALALAPKLFGDETLPIVLERPQPSAAAPSEAEAHREQMAAAQVENLRARAAALDLEALLAWRATLDPGNPHMAVAFEVVSERIDALANGAAAAPAPSSPAVLSLIEEARALEERLKQEQAAAEAGDEAARVRATDLRSRLLQLQTDIADGIDRTGGEEES